ncbi:MAG: carbon storage regulator [Zoogloeaceae bacterium]|nr:carbon storage regulator [Zoogloeaceae bacterium]
MLALGRRVGESLLIGENIVVKVLGIKGGQVRLGVEAPREIPVVREELLKREVGRG